MSMLWRELDATVAFKEGAGPIGRYLLAHFASTELRTTNVHEHRGLSVAMPECSARAAARFAEALGRELKRPRTPGRRIFRTGRPKITKRLGAGTLRTNSRVALATAVRFRGTPSLLVGGTVDQRETPRFGECHEL